MTKSLEALYAYFGSANEDEGGDGRSFVRHRKACSLAATNDDGQVTKTTYLNRCATTIYRRTGIFKLLPCQPTSYQKLFPFSKLALMLWGHHFIFGIFFSTKNKILLLKSLKINGRRAEIQICVKHISMTIICSRHWFVYCCKGRKCPSVIVRLFKTNCLNLAVNTVHVLLPPLIESM